MEAKKEEGEVEIQEHGPEHWFSKWERQCLAEAEQEEPSEDESEQSRQKLWHLFQNSATAVAQLYKDRVCQQQGLSLWVPFQNAATAVTNLYKELVESHQRSYELGIQRAYHPLTLSLSPLTESVESHQRSYELGIQRAYQPLTLSLSPLTESVESHQRSYELGIQRAYHPLTLSLSPLTESVESHQRSYELGIQRAYHPLTLSLSPLTESVESHQRSYELGIQRAYQRRNKDVLAWVKKRRRNIRREDLISFLCGKAPPPRNPRRDAQTPKHGHGHALSVMSPSRPPPTESGSLAISLSGAMASISVRSGAPGSPTHLTRDSPVAPQLGRNRRNGLHDVDLNTFIAEEMALHLENAAATAAANRKRASAQCSDVITDSPTHKRNRML
ncbi:unnamed protein product [Coregonus sp. 'balchen']|nr:unnamed protein product [Coregonus sp. 'balchen']